MSPRINSKGRGGGGPPPLKSIPVQLKSIPWGGGGHYWFYHFFLGGGVKGPFLWYINSVPWPNQFWTHPYLCKQELQLCSSRARFRDKNHQRIKHPRSTSSVLSGSPSFDRTCQNFCPNHLWHTRARCLWVHSHRPNTPNTPMGKMIMWQCPKTSKHGLDLDIAGHIVVDPLDAHLSSSRESKALCLRKCLACWSTWRASCGLKRLNSPRASWSKGKQLISALANEGFAGMARRF